MFIITYQTFLHAEDNACNVSASQTVPVESITRNPNRTSIRRSIDSANCFFNIRSQREATVLNKLLIVFFKTVRRGSSCWCWHELGVAVADTRLGRRCWKCNNVFVIGESDELIAVDISAADLQFDVVSFECNDIDEDGVDTNSFCCDVKNHPVLSCRKLWFQQAVPGVVLAVVAAAEQFNTSICASRSLRKTWVRSLSAKETNKGSPWLIKSSKTRKWSNNSKWRSLDFQFN